MYFDGLLEVHPLVRFNFWIRDPIVTFKHFASCRLMKVSKPLVAIQTLKEDFLTLVSVGADIVDDDNNNENDRLSDILDDSEHGSEVESLDVEEQAELKATLEAIQSGKDESADIVVPTMGQLVKVNGTNAIISGGQPNERWTGLMSPTGSYRSPLQLRTLDKVSAKDYKYRCEKISNLTISKDSNLVLVGDIMKRNFEEQGIDTITFVPDPASKGNTLCVLSDHAKLTKEEAIELSKKISKRFDFLD